MDTLHPGLGLLAVIGACGTIPEVAAAPGARAVTIVRTVTLDDVEPAKPTRLKVGEFLELHVRENGSMGERWDLKTKAPTYLRLIENKWQSARPARARMSGGSSTHVFRFQAVAAGKAAVTLERKRPGVAGQLRAVQVTIEALRRK